MDPSSSIHFPTSLTNNIKCVTLIWQDEALLETQADSKTTVQIDVQRQLLMMGSPLPPPQPIFSGNKPTLLRIGEATALPVMLCGLLQKELVLQQQHNQLLLAGEPRASLLDPQTSDVETFDDDFLGLINQRYQSIGQTTSACHFIVTNLAFVAFFHS